MSNVPKPRVFQVKQSWVDTYEYPVGVLHTLTYPAMWNWHCACKEKQRDRSMPFFEALKGANEHSRIHTAERVAEHLGFLSVYAWAVGETRRVIDGDTEGWLAKKGEGLAYGVAEKLVREHLVKGKA